jgi:hypothetical protein
VLSLICDAMARGMPLSCKRPALWVPGAIPTVDFLLHHFAWVVKKVDVKNQDWIRRRIQQIGKRSRIAPDPVMFVVGWNWSDLHVSSLLLTERPFARPCGGPGLR